MCPTCRSDALKIKRRAGFERLMVFVTGKRKYMCRDCETFFRAYDRRRLDREGNAFNVPASLDISSTGQTGVRPGPGLA